MGRHACTPTRLSSWRCRLFKRSARVPINVLIGYGYHPVTTGTYIQAALEKRATTTFVGTPWGARPGFAATGDIGAIVADLPEQPDLYLHVDSGSAWYFPRGLTNLPCPTACYLIDVHIQPKAQLARALFFDYAFSAQRDFVDVLRRAGHPHAYWLPLACDPALNRRYDLPKRYDIGFIGATGKGYERRRALLERLGRRYTINDYRRPYTPREMARLYSESRIVFNCSLHNEVNMRVFEGPASGAVLLTDRIDNGLSELVTDREHVVMYDDDGVLDLADELLHDDALRERIARQGYEHVRAYHTYERRVATLLDVICCNGATPRLVAPLRQMSYAEVELAYANVFARAEQLSDTLDQVWRGPRTLSYKLAAMKQALLCAKRILTHP